MKERFSAQCVVSNLQKHIPQLNIKDEVRKKLIQQIASHIAEATIQEHEEDFITTYSCRVIVCDDNKFWQLVDNKVKEYYLHQTPVWIKDGEIK
jgi:hypothetical protein